MCTEQENPYLDFNESKVVFSNLSKTDQSTLDIFGRDSFSVKLYLREYLSNFSLTATHNRFWSDTIITSDKFDINHTTFKFSFYDTGWQEITIVSHLFNGDSVAPQKIRFYARSPLIQKTLEIKTGDTAILSTPSVIDDVFYVWDLHSIIIKEYKSESRQYFSRMPSSSVGELYVIDRKEHRSPSSFFVIKEVKKTQTPARITILNDSVVNDTVYTSSSSIQLSGNISSNTPLKTLQINSLSVKTVRVNDTISYFSHDIQKIDSLSPVVVILSLTDSINNVISDTFFIKYIETSIDINPDITILGPTPDSSTSNIAEIQIYGNVSNSSRYPSGRITYSQNGNLQSGFISLTDGSFTIPVKLESGKNNFNIRFIEDTLSGNVLSDKQIIISYDPGAVDNTGPSIDVFCNNVPLIDSALFRSQKLNLVILSNDINSVKSVTVNGIAAIPSSDSTLHVPTFSADMTLVHPVNTIEIVAVDGQNNPSTKTINHIRYNQLPVISCDYSDNQGVVDTPFVWKTIVTDPDNDTVTVTATVNSDILTLSNDSCIRWIPEQSDTGWHNVTIYAYDKMETDSITFNVNVMNKADTVVKVKWLSDPSNVPDTLISGVDTLLMQLKANVLSNMRPFHYRVELTDVNKVLLDSNDSTLVWIPDSNDLGFHSIKFTISDNSMNTDVFTDNILVVNPVQPTIQFLNASGNHTEDSVKISIPVTLSAPSKTVVTVGCEIIWHDSKYPMEAVPGDYDDSYPRELTFAPGDTVVNLEFQMYDDEYFETDEKMPFKIFDPSANAKLGNQTVTIFTIIDDDYATFSFDTSAGSGYEKNFGVDSVYVHVSLSKSLNTYTKVAFSVASEYTNATYDDYKIVTTSPLEFPPGKTEDSILVEIKSNVHLEKDEVVALMLSPYDNTMILRKGNTTLYKYTILGTKP